MSKPPLYVKLKGDEFAEGEICIDLSCKVTCITGEIDLMRLLRQIRINLCAKNVPIINTSAAIYQTLRLKEVLEFASKVIGRECLNADDSITDMAACYLIGWATNMYVRLLAAPNKTAKNCSDVIMIAYPEAFLSPKQQSRLMPALLQLLPNARFVVATQSPIILTSISPNKKDYYIYMLEIIEDHFGNKDRISAPQLQNDALCVYGMDMSEAYYTFSKMERAVPEVD